MFRDAKLTHNGFAKPVIGSKVEIINQIVIQDLIIIYHKSYEMYGLVERNRRGEPPPK